MASEEAKKLYNRICQEADREVALLKSWGVSDDEIYRFADLHVRSFILRLEDIINKMTTCSDKKKNG